MPKDGYSDSELPHGRHRQKSTTHVPLDSDGKPLEKGEDGRYRRPSRHGGGELPLYLISAMPYEQIRRARMCVASNAQSADDCKAILEALGLLPAQLEERSA
jgi:hypothetical protein